MLKPMLIAGAVALTAAAPASPSYRTADTIAGPDGGWDYASVDAAHHRLFVARSTSVTVFDTVTGQVVGTIGQVARGHAALPLPGNRLLVTSGDDDSVRILDVVTGMQRATIAVGDKPDAAILDPVTGHALVMNTAGGSVSEIDVAAMKVVRTIALKPGLEFGQVARRTLFVNNEDANEIETVDLQRGTAGAPIALPGCEAPSGLAHDAASGRLISACANGKAAIVDTRRRRLIALLDIGRGPDAVILDATRRLAFIPCGKDGRLDVLALDGLTGVHKLVSVPTAVGARTGAVDPVSGAIYLPTSAFAAPTSPDGRPTPRPGSFRVLVVRPA